MGFKFELVELVLERFDNAVFSFYHARKKIENGQENKSQIQTVFGRKIYRKLKFCLSSSKNGREFGLFTVTPFLRKWPGI